VDEAQLIYAAGFDDMGRRVATLHQIPGGAWTMHLYTNPREEPRLFTMPNLRESIRELKRSGATFVVATPAGLAVPFMESVFEALAGD